MSVISLGFAVIGVVLGTLVAWQGLRDMAALGARRSAFVVVLLIAGFLGVAFAAALPLPIVLIAGAVSLVSLFRPALLVRLTGGHRAEWSLLRERARLYRLSRRSSAVADDEFKRQRLLDVENLSRYRTSRTVEYIDLIQASYSSRRPAGWSDADEQARLDRIAELEGTLYASLGAVPAWERDDQSV